MSRNIHHSSDAPTSTNQKWQRREAKRTPKMRVHGQQVKKLATMLMNKKSSRAR